jgi:hypothetical protein
MSTAHNFYLSKILIKEASKCLYPSSPAVYWEDMGSYVGRRPVSRAHAGFLMEEATP